MDPDENVQFENLKSQVNALENLLARVTDENRPFVGEQLDPHTELILKRNVLKIVSANVYGATAATATNYGCFFIADRPYEVVSITESHNIEGSDLGAVTLTVEKCFSGSGTGTGAVLLATAFNLKSTANTPVFGTLTTTKASLLIKKGDRLVLKDSGTLTGVQDVCVTVILRER